MDEHYVKVSTTDLKRWQYRPADEAHTEMQYYLDRHQEAVDTEKRERAEYARLKYKYGNV